MSGAAATGGTARILRAGGAALLLLLAVTLAPAQTRTVFLPDHWCGGSDGIFADGHETGGVFASRPSLGSGGGFPGAQSRSFDGGSFGTQTWYVHVPQAYQPAQAMPLLIVLHGFTGSPAAANNAAISLRNQWSAVAEARGFIIAAPVANGPSGDWLAPDPGDAQTSDYDMLDLMLADAAGAWNIEQARIMLWGFSAGGHIAWDLLLNHGDYVRPTPLHAGNLAAMAVAGANAAFACWNSPALCEARVAALPRRVPIDIHIGTADPNRAWALADHQRLLAHGWMEGRDHAWVEFVGGHTYTTAQLQEAGDWACGFAIDGL